MTDILVRNNQRVFAENVDLYLRRIDFAADGYAQLIRLPQYCVADAIRVATRAAGPRLVPHAAVR